MKYKRLLFTPVAFDIPNREIPNIKYSHLQPKNFPYWNFEQLLDRDQTPPQWRDDLDEYRSWLKTLVDQLPFVELHNVRLTRQVARVNTHLDIHPKDIRIEGYERYRASEPHGYRFVLKGGLESLKLLVRGVNVTAKIPHVPCLYVINSTYALHSVDEDDRITLYVRGFVDEKKNDELIEKSLDLYRDYSIWV